MSVRLLSKKYFFPFLMAWLFFSWSIVLAANYNLKNLTPEEKQVLFNLREERWEANSRNILKRISTFRGEAGITVKDLKTGWTFLHNEDQPFPAASLVKIPVMVACFKAAQDGLIDLEAGYVLQRKDKTGGSGLLRRMRSGRVFTFRELVDYMVTESDNTAANILIDKLGFDYINRVFREIGLKKTVLNRKMIDFNARDQGMENYTTAAEITSLLEKIYYGQCFNQEISQKCLEVLKRQKINDRLPRYLPKGVIVAHKTGLEKEVCHDAGIVFTPYGDYIITVLVHTWGGPTTAKNFIARLSSYFYQVFKT
ncbi:MAG: serine hydrolase [Candidatus Saccharicenans sp.]|nr:serine hydrolase [Candidatus Aminicenantes bacterium]